MFVKRHLEQVSLTPPVSETRKTIEVRRPSKQGLIPPVAVSVIQAQSQGASLSILEAPKVTVIPSTIASPNVKLELLLPQISSNQFSQPVGCVTITLDVPVLQNRVSPQALTVQKGELVSPQILPILPAIQNKVSQHGLDAIILEPSRPPIQEKPTQVSLQPVDAKSNSPLVQKRPCQIILKSVVWVQLGPLTQKKVPFLTLGIVLCEPSYAPRIRKPRLINGKKPPYNPHPVMEDFKLYAKKHSYAEIFAIALRQGSLGDIRMLKKRHLLERSYQKIQDLKQLEEGHLHLPKSKGFKDWLEIDQEQINLLIVLLLQYCKGERKESLKIQRRMLAYLQGFLNEEKNIPSQKKLWVLEKALEDLSMAISLARLGNGSHVLEKALQFIEAKLVERYLNLDLLVPLIDAQIVAIEESVVLKRYTRALVFCCGALSDCERVEHNPKIEEKKRKLLITKAFLYRSLGLTHCHMEALKQAIAFGKQTNPGYVNHSLHRALGLAFKSLNQREEAEEQFAIANSKRKKFRQKGVKLLPQLPSYQEKNEILKDFQKEEILKECSKLLKMSETIPPLWEIFAAQVGKATTLSQVCEALFSCYFPIGQAEVTYFLKILRFSNIPLNNVAELEEIKGYVLKAVDLWLEKVKNKKEGVIQKLEEIQKSMERLDAFCGFKVHLAKKLREGKRVIPISSIRPKIQKLIDSMKLNSLTPKQITEGLSEIIELNYDHELLEIINDEVVEVLQRALETDFKISKIEGTVLQFTGKNIFLSQIKERINFWLKQDSSVQDIHILGTNVYINCDLVLPGINVAFGGEYGEFITLSGPLTIDLSGRAGKAADLKIGKAPNGTYPCGRGENGNPGNDGYGGQCGGDLCLNFKEPPIVGFESSVVKSIYLSGGNGGVGSNGQAGGNGAEGVKGSDGRQSIEKGDAANSYGAFVDIRPGGKGARAGDGGRGGDCGLGGSGGKQGRFLSIPFKHTVPICIERGKNGGDGEPGCGGQKGQGKPDGLDYILLKGGAFSKYTTISGYGLYIVDGEKQYTKEGWKEAFTAEQSATRNNGNDGATGGRADQIARQRKETEKKDLKEDLFKANLAKYIQESGQPIPYASPEVLERKARLLEQQKILEERLSKLQEKIKKIEIVHKTTSALLEPTPKPSICTKFSKKANPKVISSTTNLMHLRILKFLKKDNLFFHLTIRPLTQLEREKKQRWFQGRLNQMIESIARHHYKIKHHEDLSPKAISALQSFAHEIIVASAKLQDKNTFREFFRSRRTFLECGKSSPLFNG